MFLEIGTFLNMIQITLRGMWAAPLDAILQEERVALTEGLIPARLVCVISMTADPPTDMLDSFATRISRL